MYISLSIHLSLYIYIYTYIHITHNNNVCTTITTNNIFALGGARSERDLARGDVQHLSYCAII